MPELSFLEWDGGGHGEGLFRKKQNLGQPRAQYQSSLLPPPTPCLCLEADFCPGGRRRQLSGRDGAESASPPAAAAGDREGGRSLGRSGSSESSELTQGPESEGEGVRLTLNLDRRAAPAKGLPARASAGVRGTPATQDRHHTTPLRIEVLHGAMGAARRRNLMPDRQALPLPRTPARTCPRALSQTRSNGPLRGSPTIIQPTDQSPHPALGAPAGNYLSRRRSGGRRRQQQQTLLV